MGSNKASTIKGRELVGAYQKAYIYCVSNSNNNQIYEVRLQKPFARLVDYCAREIPSLGSRTAAKKAIMTGRLLLNGEAARLSDLIRNGDVLELQSLFVKARRAVKIDLDIVYEDDYIIVVNKPGGIAVNGSRDKTVENALQQVAQKSQAEGALPFPVATHRLDVPTKGLVLLAKTKRSLIRLNKAFQAGKVSKAYIAVVHGKPPASGRIDQPVNDKEAITDFERLEVAPSRVFGHLSLLRLTPITGRTHQLRIHLKEKGHLVVGDRTYAERTQTILGKGLFLCSCMLAFEHPENGEKIRLEIEPPTRFNRLLEREAKRFE